MSRILIPIIALFACGASSPPPPPPPPAPGIVEPAPPDPRQLPMPTGKHGEVCEGGAKHIGKPSAPCQDDLQCCYPCGIAGCDYVCETAVECAHDKLRD